MSQLLFLVAKTASLATVLAFVIHTVQSQINPAFTQKPAVSGSAGSAGTVTNTFYFDSASDCNKPIRELYGSKAVIKGSDPSSTRQGQTTCTIRLQSTGQFESTIIDIEAISINIQDCDVQVSIYDGDGAQQLMMAYDCRTSQNQNRKRFITSGNTVTFMMSRRNVNSANFDIEIIVTPIRGGINPSDQNNFGIDHYFDKFPQTAIVGLIGAFYTIVIIICTVIIIYFSRSYWGLNKHWETHQLETLQTGTTFDKKHLPSSVWSVDAKQKQGLAVTNFNVQKNMTSKTVDDSDNFYNDKVLQKRFINEEKSEARPRYASSNASFATTAEDSECFQEKTRSHHKARKGQKPPPSYNDVSDVTSENSSSNDDSEVTSTDSSVKKPSSVHKTSRSRKYDTDSDTESRTDEESENSSSRRADRTQRKRHNVRHKTKQQKKHDVKSVSQPNPPQPQLLPSQAQVPYNAYPTGHFIPMMTNVPHFQPPPVFPTLPPPTYTERPARQPVQPTEPPVYSYLVRRGYTPLDVESSSVVSHTLRGQRPVVKHSEEPELRLESGVEYMNR
ncbi:unnamed protein product [Candidula unifasciata]|uniref:CUB domain-containing protein n=1 Tax=Candidula unifasciata TaxID=100452 RepID=A0A8S3ZGB3_9EUPU|nr:unnamed protein product [Candidula unifasciata]